MTQLYAGCFRWAKGWTQSAHGRIRCLRRPLKLLAAAVAPTRPAPGPGELVTPTETALVTADLAEFRQPSARLTGTGMGADRRSSAGPTWPASG
ncbi:MAG: nickel insertion protein [Caldilineaceae bacterium]